MVENRNCYSKQIIHLQTLRTDWLYGGVLNRVILKLVKTLKIKREIVAVLYTDRVRDLKIDEVIRKISYKYEGRLMTR